MSRYLGQTGYLQLLESGPLSGVVGAAVLVDISAGMAGEMTLWWHGCIVVKCERKRRTPALFWTVWNNSGGGFEESGYLLFTCNIRGLLRSLKGLKWVCFPKHFSSHCILETISDLITGSVQSGKTNTNKRTHVFLINVHPLVAMDFLSFLVCHCNDNWLEWK